MNDVNMNTVQQVAAKWVQSAQTAEAKEAQAVQNPLDFSENNVTMTTARSKVAPSGPLHLEAPKGFVGADNAVLLQRNVTSAANSFRAFGADQDRAADLTEAFSQYAEKLSSERRNPVDKALQAFRLISETSNKQRDTQTKIAAEMSNARVKTLDGIVDKKKAKTVDTGKAIAAAVCDYVADIGASGKGVGNKTSKALSGMVEGAGKAAGAITKAFAQKNEQEDEIEETESRKKLETITAASAGVKALANQADALCQQINEARKAAGL